ADARTARRVDGRNQQTARNIENARRIKVAKQENMELDIGVIYAFAGEFLKEDLGRGDVTTAATVRGGVMGRGRFLAKQDFILCGLEIAEAVFSTLDSQIQVESRAFDGAAISAGTEFARVESQADVL